MERVEGLIKNLNDVIIQIDKLEDRKYELSDELMQETKGLDREELLKIYPLIKSCEGKFKLFEKIKAIKGFFISDGTDGDRKLYKTKDEEYSLIVRPDGFFMLYELNHKDDVYDWIERKFQSFEECEIYLQEKGYVPPTTSNEK